MRQRVVTAERGALAAVTTQAQDIADLAQAKLRASAYPGLRVLDCDFQDGVLVIRGRVCSYYLKQLAQTLIRQMPGIKVIQNQVRVVHS
jgi:hypothetical protein